MKKSRYTAEQVAFALRQPSSGDADPRGRHGRDDPVAVERPRQLRRISVVCQKALAYPHGHTSSNL